MALLRDALPDERDRAIRGKRADTDLAVADEGNLDVEELEGGGALVTEPKDDKPESGFQENLAEVIDETELDALCRDLLRKIEYDKDARRKRDQQYEEGLKRTGLAEDAPGGAQFTGASKAVHPMLTEACVDFHASAMKELFPPTGPVRTLIIGEQTPEQLKIADRQFRYMNWQLTELIEEYAEELAVTMTQLPMGGSQYMKFWDDDLEGRPCCEFVPIDDLLLPYACQSFWSAHRITHVQRLGESIFEERVASGMYRDLELAAPAETPETTRAGKASERIEGVEQPPENLDGLRIVYEVNTFLKLSVDDDERRPYLVTLDERTNKILSVYRNWEEQDKRCKRLHWIADFGFIPWRGAYKMGIAQMLGGLSAAATGALRALLDSALVQTIPVLAKLKGAKFGAQTKTVDPMSITEVEAGVGVDDIRKVLMALPFNPPSPVLYALLGWLSETAKGVVTTAEEKIADASNSMPVGTALALIESGAKVFSAIHAGLHRSQGKALKILARINKHRVDKEGQIEKFGSVICTEEDFRHPLGVIPVSDPNIFSEGQRYAQMQLVTSFALGADPKTGMPTTTAKMHDQYAVLHRTYELAKIPNIDEILPPPKKPTELNAAAENSAVMLGNPIMAFPEQEHFAHLETHMRFVIDPLLGGNPAAIPTSWPHMIEHIKQHLSFLYAKEMHDLASEALGADIVEAMKDRKNWSKIDQLLAAASRHVHERLSQILAPLGPTINAMIQKIESMKPPAPMDPSQAAITVAKMEDARGREKDARDAKLKGADLQERGQKDAASAQAKDRELDIKEVDVQAKHGLGAAKHVADEQHRAHERSMAEAGHELDLAGHEHGAAMDEHGAALNEQDQQHRHTQEAQQGQREAQAQQHSQALDVAGHQLAADGQVHDQRLAEGEQAMKLGGQIHDHHATAADLELRRDDQSHSQAMDLNTHVASVQQDEHGRRMAEADLGQRKTEHKDGLAQADKDRKAEDARAKAQAQAKSKSTSKGDKK